MNHPIDLYRLMPLVYRREDASLGFPLEALLDIISTEAGHVQRNITDLWDDFFIETCAEWAVPYIADLVGSTPLHKVAGTWRADVANTIHYRRRKGTVAMLEQMASAVTGWSARVVPFFTLLEWSQYLDHVRRDPARELDRSDRVGTVNLGNVDALDRLNGPFDVISHSIDVRAFQANRGRHNIRKIGFFLWRLQSNPLHGVTPRPSASHPHGYHFSPIGNSAPLFTNKEIAPENESPSETDFPGPLRRLALHYDLKAAEAGGASRYFGPESHHSISVAIGGAPVPAEQVTVCNLSDWRLPGAGKLVAIDPVRGRMTIDATAAGPLEVNYCYGFSGGAGGDLGGGPYDRRAGLRPPETKDFHIVVAATRPTGLAPPTPWRTTIRDAVDAWLGLPSPPLRAIVEVLDSRTYEEGSLTLRPPAAHTLELRAANGQRPVLGVSALVAGGRPDSRLTIDGLIIMGAPLHIVHGLTELALRHCTLVPGRNFNAEGVVASPNAESLVASTSAGCAVTIANSITGPIRLPAEGFSLSISDSIVDSPSGGFAIAGPGGEYGPTSDLRRLSVLGKVRVRCVGYASGVIFAGDVESERTQTGCVRFSYVPDIAVTPRRCRCQPDLALDGITSPEERVRIRIRLRPRFTTRTYGQPGYGQLAHDAAAELMSGGESEAEMGAFNRLLQTQRVANLWIRLDEYLPAGLEAGLIYQT